MNKITTHNKNGFALFLALIIASIALAIGLSMLHITLMQLTLGTTIRESEIAFQIANAGMECLRFSVNNDYSAFQTDGGTVTLDCLGDVATSTDSNANPKIQEFHHELNSNFDTKEYCIQLETYTITASTSDTTLTFAAERNRPDKVCSAGDICSIAFVRGFNRSCTDVTSSIFTVQRELSIEF